jgi:thiamine transport system permease protein
MSGPTPLRVRDRMRNRGGRGAEALAAAIPAALILLPLLAFVVSVSADPGSRREFAEAAFSLRPYRVAGFTVLQALLSAAAALLAGIPLGFAASRGPVFTRRPLTTLFSLPFALPSILVAMGFAGFYGISGTLNGIFSSMGAKSPFVVYGLPGILLAHAFYNFPIIGRLVADSLSLSDPAHAEAARLLGAGTMRRFFTIGLREAMPGIAAGFILSFLYCLQSFGIVLLLGGGPAASTLEVEIYESMRTSFREGRALAFAVLETAVGLAAAICYERIGGSASRPSGRDTSTGAGKESGKGFASHAGTAALILLLLVFAGGPALSVISSAFSPSRKGLSFPSLSQFSFLMKGGFSSSLVQAIMNTAATGIPAAFLSTLIALACASLRGGRRTGRIGALSRVLPLAVSPLMLSTSISSLTSGVPGFLASRVLLPLFHALLALPLATHAIDSGLEKLSPSLLGAARCLGAKKAKAFADVAVPAILPSILSSLAFSFAISAADISGPLTLPHSDFPTLSLLVYRLAGAYRFGAASASGIILLAITGIAFGFSRRGK